MIRVIDAELFKLRTTRAFYVLVGGVLGAVLLFVILDLALSDVRPLSDVIGFALFLQVMSMVLGILAVTSDFRHGTITPTLLVTPVRLRLMLAKLAAAVITALALGLVASVLIWLLAKAFGQDTSGAGRIILGTTLAVGLYAALGVGLGALIRNQVGAIVGPLLYLLLGETLIALIPHMDDVVSKYGLNGSAATLAHSSIRADAGLSQGVAGLVLAGWCAIFLVAGFALMQRRDVSA